MAFKLAPWVMETTLTTGTSNFALAGAVANYLAFASFLANGDTTYYVAINGAQREEGIGTFNAGVLERTTVLASTNGGAKVSFAAGARVFCEIASADSLHRKNGVAVDAAQVFSAAQQTLGRANIGAIGNLYRITVITASDPVWSPDSKTKFLFPSGIGGGGAGGGVPASTGAGQASAGGGGGAGGVVSKFIARPTGTVAIVVGAGGAGVSGTTGGNGGSSTWSDGANTLTAGGGSGGATNGPSATGTFGIGGDGGTASGGDINIQGAKGAFGIGGGAQWTGSSNFGMAIGGMGGNSLYGPGGQPAADRTSTASGSSGFPPASGFGGGGSGGFGISGASSVSAVLGGNGRAGGWIIAEYI